MAERADIDEIRSPGPRERLRAFERDTLVVTTGQNHGGKGERLQQHRAEAPRSEIPAPVRSPRRVRIVLKNVLITRSDEEGASDGLDLRGVRPAHDERG